MVELAQGEMAQTVEIYTGDYAVLISNSKYLEILVNAIFNGAKLSWDGEHLQFVGDLEPIIRAIFPAEYDGVLNALKTEREENNGAD